MTSILINTSALNIAGIATLASDDMIVISKTGEVFSPTTSYSLGVLIGVNVEVAGYFAAQFFTLNSSNTFTIAEGGIYSGRINMFTDSSTVNNGTFLAKTDGIFGGGGCYVQNNGTITAGDRGVVLNTFGSNTDVLVNNGTISAKESYGVFVSNGSANITNHGTIQSLGSLGGSAQNGMFLNGVVRVNNTGIIEGTNVGIKLGENSSLAAIVNSGLIRGQERGIDTSDTLVTSNHDVINSGTISGTSYSYFGNGFADFITNSGTMTGWVSLGGGSDLFDTRGGTVNGDIYLDVGDDIFNGLGATIRGAVHGGAGIDTYTTDDALLDIVEDAIGGEIDTVIAATSFVLAANIENLTLIGSADFSGQGNDGANFIFGNAGHNRLTGLLGNDTLFGNLGDDRLLGGAGVDSLDGGDGDDTLQGNLGNDVVKGADGDDVLNGGLGKDTHTGGTGADSFVFSGLSQTGATQALADVITDFTQGEDFIDLSAIDAKRANPIANDAFTFIPGAFTGVAGQLRAIQNAGNTFVEMDVDGNSVADAVIRLNGLYTLTAADFVL